jgi:hypothetical protein
LGGKDLSVSIEKRGPVSATSRRFATLNYADAALRSA